MASATTFYDFSPKDKRGSPFPLDQFRGKVVLAINIASKCGFTPQLGGLEKLYKQFEASHPGRFVILAFPCSQFNNQSPGTNEELQEFCQLNYGVTFPVLAKTDVNGSKAEPLWDWMKAERPGIMGLKRVKWNFEKFLIGKDGKVAQRFASNKAPDTLRDSILQALAV